MKINDLVKEAHDIALSKGWYNNGDRNIAELIALIHSELSEALEEVRKDSFKDSKYNNYSYFVPDKNFPNMKPEGFGIEIADVVIRIADLCGYLNVDLEKAIQIKIEYNKTREHRHGGKAF